MSAKKKPIINKQSGVTLVELIISLTIFLLGISIIYGVVRLANLQKSTVNTRTDQIRSARIALEYIRRDTLNAGFGFHRTGGNMPDNVGNSVFGMKADTDTERDFMTSVMGGNDVNSNTLNFGVKTDVLVLVNRDQTFNNGGIITYTKAEANGTAVDVTTQTDACTNCKQYDLYLFESSSGTTQLMGMVTKKNGNSSVQFATGSDDPFGFNQSATASGNNQSLLVTTAGGGTMKRINLVSYTVTSDGVLVRTKYGNNTDQAANKQKEQRELVYGVSDFQIKYYMEDGTTVDDPSSGNDGRTNQIKMNSVVQVQVSITLAPDSNNSQPVIKSPITIKEFISTKNLRYEAS